MANCARLLVVMIADTVVFSTTEPNGLLVNAAVEEVTRVIKGASDMPFGN